MIRFIRKKKVTKLIACTIAFSILSQCFTPSVAYALTGGPSQPEVQSFEPIGTSEMVDPFSGDFNYNIPLIDVGGYPINLSYHSGLSMDQEASWVGLGWNINPGVIVRNMRGVPDDFDGDKIDKEFNMRSNITMGISASYDITEIEMFGLKPSDYIHASLGLGAGLRFNNYYGLSVELSVTPEINCSQANKFSESLGLGFSTSSESGLGISPHVSFSKRTEESNGRDITPTVNIGLPYNSRAGLRNMTISTDVQRQSGKQKLKDKDGKSYEGYSKDRKDSKYGNNKMSAWANGSSSISFASSTYTPKLNFPLINGSFSLSFTVGGSNFGVHNNVHFRGYYSQQILNKNSQSVSAFGYLNLQDGQNMDDDVMLDFNREKDGAFTENTPSLPLSNLTYDIYSVSGQGIGGMYRPHRSDVGYVFDGNVTNYTGNIDFPGIEIGVTSGTHIGINFSANFSEAESGKWQHDNPAAGLMSFKDPGALTNLPLYEPAYFTQVGEKAVDSDPDMFNNFGGFNAISVELADLPQSESTLETFLDLNGNRTNIPSINYRKKRAKRNEEIYLMNADDASIAAECQSIEIYNPLVSSNGYKFGSLNDNPPDKPFNNRYIPMCMLQRKDDRRLGNHTSQITTYRADGARYVYGIPAYNYNQQEATFAITGGSPDCSTDL